MLMACLPVGDTGSRAWNGTYRWSRLPSRASGTTTALRTTPYTHRPCRNPPLYEAGMRLAEISIRPVRDGASVVRRAVVEYPAGRPVGGSQVTPHQVVYGLPRRSKAELLETGQYPRCRGNAGSITKNSLRLQVE